MKETNVVRLHLKFEKKLLPNDILLTIKKKELISGYSNCFPLLPTSCFEDDETIVFSFELNNNSMSNIWLKTDYWRNIPFKATTEVINKKDDYNPSFKIETASATRGQLVIIVDTKDTL